MSHIATATDGQLLASVPVMKTADGAVTVLKKTVSLRAGQKAYLYATPLRTKVLSWGTGSPTNIGHTLAIKCTDSSGRQAINGHWASNIRPKDASVSPMTRVLLEAPTDGTYTCLVTATGYSNGAASGMKLGVYAADAQTPQLNARIYTNASTWTSVAPNDAPGFAVAPSKSLSYLTQTIDIPHTADSWSLIADGQFSSCKDPQHFVPVCNSSSTGVQFSTISTQIQVLPLNAAGAQCAKPYLSPARTIQIDDAMHHRTMTNTLVIRSSVLKNTTIFPAQCSKAKVSLIATVTAGDYAIAHDNYNYAHALSLVRP